MDVRRNDQRSRYELFDDDVLVGIADFRVDGDVVVFPHTEIVPERRGHGLGDVLVKAALDDVRTAGRTIVAPCWFVAEFVELHSEYHDLRASAVAAD